jgi:hypothetical protein
MSVDEVAVLRAAGLESAAKVIEAARAGQVAAQPPAAPAAPDLTPGQVYAAEQQQAAAQQTQPVAGAPGQLTRAELDGMNQAQVVAYMNRPGGDDEVNRILREGA